VTCPEVGGNPEKLGLIPHTLLESIEEESLRALWEGLGAYQVVGGVTAYQA
jgi:hypothetical protein